MQKTELLSQLTNAKNNYILGLAACGLFASPEAMLILEKLKAQFGGFWVTFDQVARLLNKPTDRDIAVKEFLNSQLRALIKDGYELLRTYCEETGQLDTLRREAWYEFARLIRNCLSPSFRFKFGREDKPLLPVRWRGGTIDASMDGLELKLEFFGYAEAWQLFEDFEQIAVNRLS